MGETSRRFSGVKVEIARGDITREAVDAIVNAANSELMGGGGVDGAIHRAGGPSILEECRRIRSASGRLPPGQAVVTTAGKLEARYVIHTVGPIWRGGGHGEAGVLAACYKNCLSLSAAKGLGSIAFPSISTGAFGYPLTEAAAVATSTVREALAAGASSLGLVRFVLFSDSDRDVYATALAALP